MCAGNRSMWFWLAIIALLCWSGSDLFSKIGCRDGRDKYNPLKMVIAVGVVMGIHAAYEIFVGGAVVTWHVMWTYLPVSLLYIGSMTLGYVGLRYIELSISSPICNSSGALVAVLCLITGTLDESITGAMRWMVIGAVALVCIGVVGLGIVESREDGELRKKRQEGSNYKYAKSWLALCLPVAYCLLDAAGTFADSLVLRTLNEDSANCAYELTFLAAAVICFIYVVIIKKDKLVFKAEAPKYAGALFETAGQFAYIYALADEAHVALSAPIISAYCVASVLWSRIFLKEKLSWKHYAMIALVVFGIVMIGVFDICGRASNPFPYEGKVARRSRDGCGGAVSSTQRCPPHQSPPATASPHRGSHWICGNPHAFPRGKAFGACKYRKPPRKKVQTSKLGLHLLFTAVVLR